MTGLADPFGLHAGQLEQRLRELGLLAPMPRSLTGSTRSIATLLERLDARRFVGELTPEDRLFGLPIIVDELLAADEIRIQMSDGSERSYRL